SQGCSRRPERLRVSCAYPSRPQSQASRTILTTSVHDPPPAVTVQAGLNRTVLGGAVRIVAPVADHLALAGGRGWRGSVARPVAIIVPVALASIAVVL